MIQMYKVRSFSIGQVVEGEELKNKEGFVTSDEK